MVSEEKGSGRYTYNGAAGAKTFQVVDGRNHTGFTATMAAGELSTFVW